MSPVHQSSPVIVNGPIGLGVYCDLMSPIYLNNAVLSAEANDKPAQKQSTSYISISSSSGDEGINKKLAQSPRIKQREESPISISSSEQENTSGMPEAKRVCIVISSSSEDEGSEEARVSDNNSTYLESNNAELLYLKSTSICISSSKASSEEEDSCEQIARKYLPIHMSERSVNIQLLLTKQRNIRVIAHEF